jgi:diacylglycerol kinase (ATP)
MRALLLHNPAAGGGRAARHLGGVVERLRRGGVELELHRTVSLDDARAAARARAAAVDAVVAMGGDGLVGACAAGLAEAAPGQPGGGDLPAVRAALGVIPAGGGNDGARSLGLAPGDPLAAAGLLPKLSRRRADLARAGDRWYLNIAGAGFDSEVNRLANRRLSWLPGTSRYVAALLAELVVGRPSRLRLTLDGAALEVAAWFVVVANTASYGGGMRIAPDARLDDGLLDVVVIDGALSRPRFLAAFPQVFAGTHLTHPAVSAYRAATVHVAADRPLAVYADGEPAGAVPMTFTVTPGAIAVLAREGAPGFSPPA